MMFNVINLIIIVDLFINLFFHLIQLKKFCDNEIRDCLLSLAHRVECVEHSVHLQRDDVKTAMDESLSRMHREILEKTSHGKGRVCNDREEKNVGQGKSDENEGEVEEKGVRND